MFKNKKGLSEVVTIVLIILIVVGVVAAIWLFIKPALTSTGSGLTKAQVCTSNVVEPISCVVNSIGQGNSGNSVVRRTSTNIALKGAYVIEYYTDGYSKQNSDIGASIPVDGSTTSQNVGPMTGKILNKVAVRAVYTMPDNSEVSCVSTTIDCKP